MAQLQARTLQLRDQGTTLHQSFDVQDHEASFYKTISPPLVLDDGLWRVSSVRVRTTTASLDVTSNGTSGLRIYRDSSPAVNLFTITFSRIGSDPGDFVAALNGQLAEADVHPSVCPLFEWKDYQIVVTLPSSDVGEEYHIELTPHLAGQLGFIGDRFGARDHPKGDISFTAKEPFAPLMPLNSLHICMPSTLESTALVDNHFLPACMFVDPERLHDSTLNFDDVRLDEPLDCSVSVDVKSRVISFIHMSIVTQSGRPLRFMVSPRYFIASFVLERY